MAKKILVIDDEKSILDLVKYNLEKEGYNVKTLLGGKDALKVAADYRPNLIVLDIMMPDKDGVEVCRELREDSSFFDTIIVFLTARSEEYSEVAGFDVGADDYISKPIKPRAMISRINAHFRRDKKKDKSTDTIEKGELKIDRSSYLVTRGDKEFSLPRKEFELLYFLAKNSGKVYTRDQLLKNIWGTDVYVLARTVDVHIRKVREKIGEGFIKTVKGVGYKFELD